MSSTDTDTFDGPSESEADWNGSKTSILWELILFMFSWLILVGHFATVFRFAFWNKSQHVRGQQSKLDIIMIFASLVAFPLSVFCQTTCEFMDVSGDYFFSSIGIWSVGTYDGEGRGECHSTFKKDGAFIPCFRCYPDGLDKVEFEVDGIIKLARVAGIIASAIGGAFLLLALASAIYPKMYRVRSWLAFPVVVAMISQILLLLVGISNFCESHSCGNDLGFLSAITASGYWLLCALCVYILPKHDDLPCITSEAPEILEQAENYAVS